PSVADAGDDAVHAPARLVEDLLMGGHAGVVLAPHGVVGGAVLALEDLADLDEELVGVELGVLHEADALALEGIGARHVRQRLLGGAGGGGEALKPCLHALLSRRSLVPLWLAFWPPARRGLKRETAPPRPPAATTSTSSGLGTRGRMVVSSAGVIAPARRWTRLRWATELWVCS